MRGTLISAPSLREPSSFVSFMFAGILQSRDNRRLHNEIIIEETRLKRFPHQISRLSGIYFFPDRRTAKIAVEESWGSHFAEENLTELELYSNDAITRVDASWITNAPTNPDGLLNTPEWLDDYWAGRPASQNPTWEILSNGYAIILDEKIRKKAYEIIQLKFPNSWIMMEMSRLAGEAGSDAGSIMPYVLRRENNLHTLMYLFDDKDFHDEETIRKISLHPDAGRLGYRMSQEEFWTVPDFRPWYQDFALESRQKKEWISIFSVHAPNAFPHRPELDVLK